MVAGDYPETIASGVQVEIKGRTFFVGTQGGPFVFESFQPVSEYDISRRTIIQGGKIEFKHLFTGFYFQSLFVDIRLVVDNKVFNDNG